MVVVIGLSTGASHRLNRNERVSDILRKVDESRGTGKLVELRSDGTPSRAFHIDPDQVVSIVDDGYSY